MLPQIITLQIPSESPKEFKFSQVFNDESSQKEVFQLTAMPLVLHVLNGFHGVYFVYGQTGTGKTYTMGVLNEIDQKSQGIIPSSLDLIFQHFEDQQKIGIQIDWQIHISFFQIYQEQIQDLLNPENRNMLIREENGEVFLEGLVEVPVKNEEQAMNIINAGLKHREMASQNMNQQSSRSHTILNIDVYQNKQINYSQSQSFAGRLTLVDLAGSERVRRTTSYGIRLEEAKHINASLSALGNVIACLANQKKQFIPYRSSKLTRVLQNSLNGSSKIIVLSTIGPSLRSYSESLGTLQFAQRCKEIILQPMSHTSITYENEQMSILREQINDLEQQSQRREQELLSQIQEQQKKIHSLEDMAKKGDENEEVNVRFEQLETKAIQIADLTTFLIRLLSKLAENSQQLSNEAFDLNEKINSDAMRSQVQMKLESSLDSKFPFNMERKPEIQQNQIIEFQTNDQILWDDSFKLNEIATKVQSLAKKHVENINFLSANTKNAILLKQYCRDHQDEFEKQRGGQWREQQNNRILIKEIIELKGELLKSVNFANKYGVEKGHSMKERIVKEMREYIYQQVLPQLQFDELADTKEIQIDQEILNFTKLLNQINEESMVFQDENSRLMSININNGPGMYANEYRQILKNESQRQLYQDADQNLNIKEIELLSQQDEDEFEQEIKNVPEVIKQIHSKHREQAYSQFRKHSLTSSEGGVIIQNEEEKSMIESQNSQSNKNKVLRTQKVIQRRDKEVLEINKRKGCAQDKVKQREGQEQQKMRADRLILLSKGFTEGCFVKFQNYFLFDEKEEKKRKKEKSKKSINLNKNMCLPVKNNKSKLIGQDYISTQNRKYEENKNGIKNPLIIKDMNKGQKQEYLSKDNNRDDRKHLKNSGQTQSKQHLQYESEPDSDVEQNNKDLIYKDRQNHQGNNQQQIRQNPLNKERVIYLRTGQKSQNTIDQQKDSSEDEEYLEEDDDEEEEDEDEEQDDDEEQEQSGEDGEYSSCSHSQVNGRAGRQRR